MTKTEERFKLLFSEFLTEQKRVNSLQNKQIMSIFLWGFLCGALTSYLSLLSLIIGLTLGFSLHIQYPSFINFICSKLTDLTHIDFFNKK